MPIAEVNGQTLYFESHGAGEPLLCIMGLGTDHLGWLPQLGAWSGVYRTIVFDNRDVGQSSYADGDYEISDMAQDALALADELELDSFHLVGMSMGGAIAQELALAAQERVRTLTLVVTYAGFGEWGRRRAEVRRAHVLERPFAEHIDELLLLTFSEELYATNPDLVEYVRKATLDNPHRQKPEGFVRQAEASGRFDTRDRLPSLSLPVQVIGAEYDFLVPVWKSREVARLIPGAKYLEFERAPHAVNIERAQELNTAVLEFIDSHS